MSNINVNAFLNADKFFVNNQVSHNGHWEGYAEYEDGSTARINRPYRANGNYDRECEEQYSIECELMELHEGCLYYSVDYISED